MDDDKLIERIHYDSDDVIPMDIIDVDRINKTVTYETPSHKIKSVRFKTLQNHFSALNKPT